MNEPQMQAWKDKVTALLQKLTQANDEISTYAAEIMAAQRKVDELTKRVAELEAKAPELPLQGSNGHDAHAAVN